MVIKHEMSISTRDAPWEELIDRNPYSVASWFGYLQHKSFAAPTARYILYERALLNLARSYKLWRSYLQERTKQLSAKSISDKRYDVLIGAYERSLVTMYRMPRIWLDYCALLMFLKRGTQTRNVFDRAIQNLPITQHDGIWKLYISWVKTFAVPETSILVFERYILYAPDQRETYFDYLIEIDRPGDAAEQLAKCLNDEDFSAPSGRSHHSLTMQLCDLCAANPDKIPKLLNVPAIIRAGILKYSDEVGRLWCKLADYYTRSGDFDHARSVYNEAIESVTTVRDFSIVFDAYVKVEEGVLSAIMELSNDGEDDSAGDEDGARSVEEGLARLEGLLDKRPLLLNAVVLRQNPNNVHEWLKRTELVAAESTYTDSIDSALRVENTFAKAVSAIDPLECLGKLSMLYSAHATFYEEKKTDAALNISRKVWKRSTMVTYKTTDELAAVHCGWAEMEMRQKQYQAARTIMTQAVAEPKSNIQKRKAIAAAQGRGEVRDDVFEGVTCADRLYKNIKVWSLYLDLEESLGTEDTVRAAYDRAMDLKVITVQMCMNYATFLEEASYFEESFRVFERAVHLFIYPQVRMIWITYLDKFMERYGGSKLERLRDLFEKAVSNVTPKESVEMYLKYALAEESYGTVRHALSVYERATKIVPTANRLDSYRLYIQKIVAAYGLERTRSVYESAIAILDDNSCRMLCIEFAETEKRLGDLDRARTIFQHGCQFANPKREPDYWIKWKSFEESHGNEETFRDMLRLKRTIDTKYAQINYAALDALAAAKGTGDTTNTSIGEKRKAPQQGFVAAQDQVYKHQSDDEPARKRPAITDSIEV